MPDRIPLRAGRTTPDYVEKALSVFGNNPYGEPNFRLIWSERKAIWFCGEIAEEYLYLPHPCWVLETWLAPEKDAGKEIDWTEMQEAFMGPYPRHGTYMLSQYMPADWEPSEEHVRLLAKGVIESRDIDIRERERAIRENKEAEGQAAQKLVADEILESFGSAELGKVTQAASGRANVFKTADDYGRELEKAVSVPALPRRGGKIVN